ncbi:hypothetical protein L7F22_047520 [Adiantum nelumboides]|nr:hypothetical protein [Adiantum nelumboides]
MMVKKEQRLQVKCIRSDRGGEFTSKDFSQWCTSDDIRCQLTTPYTPSQNGIDEQKNKTIVEMVGASLPMIYWTEACNTLAYIQYRFFTHALKDKTPFEAYYQHKSNVSHFRVFECPAFVHIPKEKRHKLDFKSERLIFLAYSAKSDGYRLYDPVTKHSIVSQDVVFNEPFLASSKGAASRPLPTLLPPSFSSSPPPSTSTTLVHEIQQPVVFPNHADEEGDSPEVEAACPRKIRQCLTRYILRYPLLGLQSYQHRQNLDNLDDLHVSSRRYIRATSL